MQASKWTVTYKIDHVGRKERGAGLLEEGLVGIEHAIEPWEKLLSAFWLSARTWGRDRIEPQVLGATHTVVGVENDGNAVDGSDGADVVGGSNGTGDGSLLLLSGVLHALAGEVGSATLAGLETIRMSTPSRVLFSAGCILHDGRLRLLGSLEGSDNGARDSQLVSSKKTDRGCLDHRVDALGCPARAIWNQQPVRPPNAGPASSQYHMRAGAGQCLGGAGVAEFARTSSW